jgi:hypothetical protein
MLSIELVAGSLMGIANKFNPNITYWDGESGDSNLPP